MAYTFDGAAKVISLSSGTTNIVLGDLYSRYKDWLRLGNAGTAQAMLTVGGESIDSGAGTLVPLYLFFLNGWKLRPQEANHTLTVEGGSLLVDGGGDPFSDTVGNYRVRVRYSQPAQAIGYSLSGGGSITPSQVADAVWGHATGTEIATRLAEAWGRLGLDASKPLVTGDTSITFGEIVMALTETTTTVTVTRQ